VRFMKLSLPTLFLIVAGCSSSGGPPPVAEVDGTSVDIYKIGVDDVVQVSVWKSPELSVTVPVRPDGMISVPLIGDVRAGGSSPEEVARNVELLLAEYLREPKVAIIVSDLNSHEYLSRIRITGSVSQPSSITYRQGMTVLDAVLEAGGTNEFASANKTKLYRRSDDGTSMYDIKLQNILSKGDLSTNYPLQPGDVISVPERTF